MHNVSKLLFFLLSSVHAFAVSSDEIRDLVLEGGKGNLQRADTQELLLFIKERQSPGDLDLEEFNVLRNDAADVLLAQDSPVPRLDRVMLAIANDPKHDLVWREYVIQKLPDLYLSVDNEKSRSRVLKELKSKAGDTEYIFAGTALLGLYRLSQSDTKAVAESEVRDFAWEIISNDSFAEANRITALQVGAKLGDQRAVEAARKLLAEANTSIPLRSSALATLGIANDSADLPVLEQYAKSPEYRLRTAAKAALEKHDH